MTIAATTERDTDSGVPQTLSDVGQKLPWIFISVVLLSHLPLLFAHFANLWSRSHYQYFPVVILMVGYFLYTRAVWGKDELTSGWKLTGYSCLTLSMAGLITASLLNSPWVGAIAFVFAAGGVLILQPVFSITNSFGIWMLLWLLVPLPMGLDMRLTQFLQSRTTQICGMMLDLLKIVNVVDGNTILLTTGRLFVEEACSGIVSMMAVVACSLVVAVWMNRPLIHVILVVIFGIVCAACMNLVRILTIAICQETINVNLSSGWPHELLGLVLFAVTVILMLSIDRLVLFFVQPIKGEVRHGYLTALWNRAFRIGLPVEYEVPGDFIAKMSRAIIPLCCVFGALGLMSLGMSAFAAPVASVAQVDAIMQGINESTMPASTAGWQRVEFSTEHAEGRGIFGNDSRVWKYKRGDQLAIFSVDYMFSTEWHELCECYEGVGWSRIGRTIEAPLNSDRFVVRGNFRKSDGVGTLHYSFINPDGSDYGPPSVQAASELLRRRLRKGSHRLIQLQMWLPVTDESSAVPDDEKQLLYENLRTEFVNAFIALEQREKAQ